MPILSLFLLSSVALAAHPRADTALLVDATQMEFDIVYSFSDADGRAGRSEANTNNIGESKNTIDAAENAAYEAAAVESRLNQTFAGAKWDTTDPVWTAVNASTQGLLGVATTSNAEWTLTIAGVLGLNSDESSSTHTLWINNESFTNYAITVALPSGWQVVSTEGLTVTAQSSTYVSGYATSAGYVFVTVQEGGPADVTPPFVNPGGDRTIPAGVSTLFTGTATDDDPLFAENSTIWWSFDYNGTEWNFSGSSFTFEFWTLGSLSVTFSAMDRAGNLADATFVLTVDRPDKQLPVIDLGSTQGAVAGEPWSLTATVTDNDEAFPLGASFWWEFTYNGTVRIEDGSTLSFTFWVPGEYPLSFFARDFWGNLATATLELSVVPPDLVPPTAAAGEDAVVAFGTQVSLTGTASDNDPTFPETGRTWWTFTYNGRLVNITGSSTPFIFNMAGTYELTFWAEDYWGNRANDARVLVVRDQDLEPPTISALSDQAVLAGQPHEFSVDSVTDNDPEFPSGARYWWSFVYEGELYNFTGTSFTFTFNVRSTYVLTFFATDAAGNHASAVTRVLVVSPDTEPPLVLAEPDFTAAEGETVEFAGIITDNDPGFATTGDSWWVVEVGGIPINLSQNPATYAFEKAGTYNATLWARDVWGNEGHDDLIVTVTGPPVLPLSPNGAESTAPGATQPALQWLVPVLALGLAAASGAVLVVSFRRRREEPSVILPDAPAAAAVGSSAVLATLPPRGPAYVVEGMLLLYKDGRLIHHQASSSQSMFESPEVVGSMFTAVTEFIRDSFREEASLSRLSLGQNTILLEASPHLFGAVIVYGEPDDELRDTLRDTLRRVESAYTGVVERWNGDRDAFTGVARFVEPIFFGTAAFSRTDVKASMGDRKVKLVSATEHYKGYVRLRIAIVNQTDAKIANATVTVVFNQKVLHLARVEPAGLTREGLTVHLGDIETGERLGAIYYLDPQTCSTTNIEGMATYTDAEGVQHEVQMKLRREEVVCPVFFTAQHANPASMRRLVETTLNARDAKLFRILSLPQGVDYKDMFAIAREAIQRHHVVLVRNLATRDPFEGRAWFYGQTKQSKSAVVIRATVSEERRMVEFFVAVDSPSTLTGLLAEFNRSFLEIVATRGQGIKLEPVLDDSLKGMLSADEMDGPGAVE